MQLIDKIKFKLSEYLGFDISEILKNEDIDVAYIFGGAIRDIIANKEIHDIDILTLPQSHEKISKILENNGYQFSLDLKLVDIENIYKTIKIITEPVNYLKIVDNKIKIVQLIKPAFNSPNIREVKENMEKILYNVDLSNCGIYFYHGNHGYELVSINDAYYHCLLKIFQLYDKNKLYSIERTFKRIYKLERRGWKKFDSLKDAEKQLERLKKFNKINRNNDIIFKYLDIKVENDYGDLPF